MEEKGNMNVRIIKNDKRGLRKIMLYLSMLLIIVLSIALVLIIVTKKADKMAETSNIRYPEHEEKQVQIYSEPLIPLVPEVKNESKIITLTEEMKAKINKQLQEDNLVQYLCYIKNAKTSEFNDKEMYDFACIYSKIKDKENFAKNSEVVMENNGSSDIEVTYIDTTYLNTVCKRLFSKNFDISKTNAAVKETKASAPVFYMTSQVGTTSILKVKDLILNEATGVYTLNFVDIYPTTAVDRYFTLSNPQVTTYIQSEVICKYSLKYKELKEFNILTSLGINK